MIRSVGLSIGVFRQLRPPRSPIFLDSRSSSSAGSSDGPRTRIMIFGSQRATDAALNRAGANHGKYSGPRSGRTRSMICANASIPGPPRLSSTHRPKGGILLSPHATNAARVAGTAPPQPAHDVGWRRQMIRLYETRLYPSPKRSNNLSRSCSQERRRATRSTESSNRTISTTASPLAESSKSSSPHASCVSANCSTCASPCKRITGSPSRSLPKSSHTRAIQERLKNRIIVRVGTEPFDQLGCGAFERFQVRPERHGRCESRAPSRFVAITLCPLFAGPTRIWMPNLTFLDLP